MTHTNKQNQFSKRKRKKEKAKKTNLFLTATNHKLQPKEREISSPSHFIHPRLFLMIFL
jgi:hypothetical protein